MFIIQIIHICSMYKLMSLSWWMLVGGIGIPVNIRTVNYDLTKRRNTGCEVSDVDWLPGAGGVEEDRELVIVSVTIELGSDDCTEPLNDPGVLVGPGV